MARGEQEGDSASNENTDKSQSKKVRGTKSFAINTNRKYDSTTQIFEGIPLDSLPILRLALPRSFHPFQLLQSIQGLSSTPPNPPSLQVVPVALSLPLHRQLHQFHSTGSHRNIVDLHLQMRYTSHHGPVHPVARRSERPPLQVDALLLASHSLWYRSSIVE